MTAVGRLWLRFVGFGALLATAGWLLGRAGETIAVETTLTETAVGVLLTGLASSLAELVVSIAAIRAGALTLAVGNIIGGNTFDALLVGVADIAYRPGPLSTGRLARHPRSSPGSRRSPRQSSSLACSAASAMGWLTSAWKARW